MNEHVHLESAS